MNDGGPAFPIDGTLRGMDLRDYFAAHADISMYYSTADGLDTELAAAVMGEAPPRWSEDRAMEIGKWWIEATCRVRYLCADAMLKARGAA